MVTNLKVGGRVIAFDVAHQWVSDYLNGPPGKWAYPSYDTYSTNDDPDQLCDGDLLAPVLLNVDIKIESFHDLRTSVPHLNSGLARLRHVELVDADSADLESVGSLYAVLDSDARPRSVQGTTLAKVLHRKRPALIPLYDEQVRRVYQEGEGAPLPTVKGRAWAEFMTLFAGAVRKDLKESLPQWQELAALTPGTSPPVSLPRALDIVAWHLGGS